MKTNARKCALAEAAAALVAAHHIVQVHGLSADRLDWQKPTAGPPLRQDEDGSIQVLVEKPKPARQHGR